MNIFINTNYFKSKLNLDLLSNKCIYFSKIYFSKSNLCYIYLLKNMAKFPVFFTIFDENFAFFLIFKIFKILT